MSDRNERACKRCGSLLHHEDDCEVRDWSREEILAALAEERAAHTRTRKEFDALTEAAKVHLHLMPDVRTNWPTRAFDAEFKLRALLSPTKKEGE